MVVDCVRYGGGALQPHELRKLVHQAAITSGLVVPETSEEVAVAVVTNLLDRVKEVARSLDMKHDFRGITTQSSVEPDRTPEAPGRWQILNGGKLHIYHPASESSLFNLRVSVSEAGNCHLILYPKDVTPAASPFKLESHFAVDGFASNAEVADLHRKARQLAQRLLKQQAARL